MINDIEGILATLRGLMIYVSNDEEQHNITTHIIEMNTIRDKLLNDLPLGDHEMYYINSFLILLGDQHSIYRPREVEWRNGNGN